MAVNKLDYETKLFCSKLHAECNEDIASYKCKVLENHLESLPMIVILSHGS